MIFFPILSATTTAQAEEVFHPRWSITVDSTQISKNILQLQQEWALRPEIGILFSEGFGLLENEVSYQVGLLSRYYFLGDFMSGVGIGGDISYTTYIVGEGDKKINGHLISPSLLLTGKYIFDFGFTIEPNIGLRFSTLYAGTRTQDLWISENDWDWVLGLRLGWSIDSWLPRYKNSKLTTH